MITAGYKVLAWGLEGFLISPKKLTFSSLFYVGSLVSGQHGYGEALVGGMETASLREHHVEAAEMEHSVCSSCTALVSPFFGEAIILFCFFLL